MLSSSLSYSKAFTEYLENRRRIVYLLKSAPDDSEQLLYREKRLLANVVYCSSVLLLSSYLERYVESLLVEAIDAINNANILVQDIPEALRLVQVKEQICDLASTLQKDMTKDNVLKMLQKSKGLINNHNWFTCDFQPFNQLSGETLIGENRFSNPSPEKIDQLFRHLGINSVVGRVIGLENKPDRAAIRDKVEEMVDKRNNIAHTGGTVTVTRQDIMDYLVYSRRLVRGMDILVGQEVQKIIRCSWPWN